MKRFRLKEAIIFENDDYLVINKPSGISSLEDRTLPISLIDELRKEYPEATLCHRLDKETSGCLIAAKHAEAYREAAIQFEKRTVSKLYHAFVEGAVSLEDKAVDLPIVKKVNGTAMCAQGGRPALTHFTSIENFGHYTLLECRPLTGRFHQIRVHLASMKTPIAADTLYGGKLPYLSSMVRKYKPSSREENPMLKRFALHAYQIEFEGLKGDKITVEAPYPADLATFHKLLAKNDKL